MFSFVRHGGVIIPAPVREDRRMDLSVLFLGTAGSMPTVQRAPASLLVRRGGDRILIDCGEGTQRQLLRSVGLPDIEHIFLTHYHADHFLGLPGMLKTFALRGREVPLTVYGPRGLHSLMSDLRRVYGKLTYEVRLQELEPSQAVPLRRLPDRRLRRRAPARGARLRAVRGRAPGPLRPRARARELGVPEGPQFGRLQRGEAVEADGRTGRSPHDVMGEPRPGPHARVHRRHRALRGDGRRRERRRSCWSTTAPSRRRRRSAPARPATRPRARPPRWRARRACRCSRSPISPRATSRPVIEKEARAVFERTVVPRDFDVVEVPYPDSGREPELIRWKDYKERLLPEPVGCQQSVTAASRAVATLAASVPLTRS